ncbi:hypothetical protein M405DRAFT_820661 [Rhizopogon salebrosus TDB-379]|nr:hypothetical protein M405DRAFT_820661 [Rhizopogon salebrosus TDB-379]
MSSLPVSEPVGLQITKYTNIGALAVLIFDYCITFQDEVEHTISFDYRFPYSTKVQWTWFRPWDVTRVIFVLSRYLPFVGAVLTARTALYISGPCPNNLAENAMHILSIAAAEGLLLLRTWAFWQKGRKLLIGLLSYAALTVIAVFLVNRSPILLIPGPAISEGCDFEASRNGAVVYLILAVYEGVILFLTAYKRFRDYRGFQSSIVKTIYIDGMFYIFGVMAITVTNVIIGGAFPSAYSNMFDTFQLVIHSVLASRILFRLRSSSSQVHETPLMMLSEDMRYQLPSHLQTNETGCEV